MSRRTAAALSAVLVLAVSACTVGSGPSTTVSASTGPVTSAASSTTPAPTTATTAATTTTTLVEAPGTESLPQALRTQIADLISTTQQVRGLGFLEPPQVSVLSSTELADRVRQEVLKDEGNIEADQALYTLLGLLPSGTDLRSLFADLYSEQVAGFYDGDTKELVIPSGSTELTPLEQATLVHELTHAVTDQHYQMWSGYQELLDAQRYDEADARLGLIEGDATLTETFYIRSLPQELQGRLIVESLQADTSVFDSVPLFLQRSLLFPYQDGLSFTQYLYMKDGFSSVADAYRNGPLSTEQVLHPRAYGRDEPVAVDLPEVSVPSGYELVYDSTWGELAFSLMLEQVLGQEEADTAATGWGGDHYRVWVDGKQAAMLLAYVGDTAKDSDEMASALADYLGKVVTGKSSDVPGGVEISGSHYGAVGEQGSTVTFVIASDPAVGKALFAQG